MCAQLRAHTCTHAAIIHRETSVKLVANRMWKHILSMRVVSSNGYRYPRATQNPLSAFWGKLGGDVPTRAQNSSKRAFWGQENQFATTAQLSLKYACLYLEDHAVSHELTPHMHIYIQNEARAGRGLFTEPCLASTHVAMPDHQISGALTSHATNPRATADGTR